ncbi:uncharacterized protein EKO05_0010790 [Ascochyta rabiei]|uniref:uncharacterized protein n=1 Tax=Didymella rabiei TaxID=5454 RepID=UPI00220A1555|nr:uncharacterized protein EKO05_0010790 [Ascochyta rabiei]UPX20562.1 hypothetical protein EKO05_0010790 [Ascochyta rabiei]
MNMAWDKIQKEAEKIEVRDPHSAKQKMQKLQLAMNLRRRLRERFHTRGVDTVDYTKWIAKVEADTRQLADSLLMSNMKDRRPTPETPGSGTVYPDAEQFEKIMVLQSPLSPRIPMASIQNLPDDGSIRVLKQFQTDICNDAIRRLYSIVPDLDDRPSRKNSPTDDQPDVGAEIVRSWFRIMILNDSEAEVLEHASRSRCIDEFIAGCQASQLEMYCDYFENVWRPQAVQYLRVAICAQTLAGGDIKSIRLLGGIVPSSTEGLRMTKPAWDILYRWFPTLLTPWTVASICSNFEDYTTICKLLMLGMYNEYWFDPTSILSECTIGVYLGFIPTSKGDNTSKIGPNHESNAFVHMESRNYLCGQMAMGDPFTRDFLEELRRRTNRLHLVVYEGTNAEATVHPSEPELFINRYRSSSTREGLHDADWTTTMTLEDIKNHLRLRKTSMYDPIVVDSWQFIIIDREVGRPFELLDIVQDALLMLVGDPSPRSIAKRVVRSVVPTSIQEIFLEDMVIECSPDLRFPPPHEVQYDGNRFRCHDPDQSMVVNHQRETASEKLTRNENRFIRRVVDDMERCGIITLLTDWVEPQTQPVIIQGADSALDLYFPYEHTEMASDGQRVPSLPFPPTNSLSEFAHAWKQQHPNGIMAKGSIQTHYCAWPMPAMRSLGNTGSNFATPEGHIYHWNAMPFDRPWSAHAWQYYIQHHVNNKYPFVMFYLSTFVICAADAEDAEHKTETLLEETEDRGWRISIPKTKNWKFHVHDLKLDALYSGVRPADDF